MARFASEIQVGQQFCFRLQKFIAKLRSAKHVKGGASEQQILSQYSGINPDLLKDILWYRVWITIDQPLTEAALLPEVFRNSDLDCIVSLAEAFGMTIKGHDVRILKEHVMRHSGTVARDE